MQAARNDTKATREKARPRRGGKPSTAKKTRKRGTTTRHDKTRQKTGLSRLGEAFSLKRDRARLDAKTQRQSKRKAEQDTKAEQKCKQGAPTCGGEEAPLPTRQGGFFAPASRCSAAPHFLCFALRFYTALSFFCKKGGRLTLFACALSLLCIFALHFCACLWVYILLALVRCSFVPSCIPLVVMSASKI
jgi:hypothetical protein